MTGKKESLPRILILTPFRNESHSIPKYLKSLRELNYPRKLIDMFWLENDSSDKTLQLLRRARPKMPFKSTTLKSIKIHGKVAKSKPRAYKKNIPQKRGKVAKAWNIIWNSHFLPRIRKSNVDYVLTWFADVIAPPNVIHEYLKVFKEKKNAGWVGGRCHRRYPKHKNLCSPLPRDAGKSKKIVPVIITAHCWLSPRKALGKTEMYRIPREMHLALTRGLNQQKLKVYYQPSVYLKHISTDGKIYRKK